MLLSYANQSANGSSSIAGNTKNSILGNAEKAMLILFSSISKSDNKSKLQNLAISNIVANQLSKSAETLMAQAAAESISPAALGNFRFLEVQYNPNTIQLQANAEEQPMLFLQQNLEQGVPNQLMRPPSVTLHVDLFFDAVNLSDSFMWEKFTLGLSGQTVSNIAAKSFQIEKGKVWSVQEQTNGLLGAMMNDSTRFMIFKWADMTFAGELTEANATYTMFSTSGRPVRSTVTLRITQHVESQNDIEYWNKALTDFVEYNKNAAQRTTLDNLQNIISFNY